MNVADTGHSRLARACRGERSGPRPVWFMRQAGRSLPEYREVRRGVAMLDSCLMPELAAEITLQPVRRHGVDAAVLFSDIVVPLKLAGIDVEIVPGVGPVVASPIRTLDRRPAAPRARPGGARADRGGDPDLHRRTRRDAAARVRGGAVHPRVLPRRGRTVQGAPGHQGDDVRRARRPGPSWPAGWPAPPPPSCGRRCWPGPRRCSSSTPGPAGCRWPTTPSTSPVTRPPCCPRWPTCRCRGSTSGSAPASCCRRCATPAPP